MTSPSPSPPPPPPLCEESSSLLCDLRPPPTTERCSLRDPGISPTAQAKPARPAKKIKKGTLHYALEVCDRSQLITIISKTHKKSGLEIMNIIRRSREMFKDYLTPLQGAVSLGHYNICKQLVEEGAVLESTTSILNPLCIALKKGYHDIAHLLIEAGADVKTPMPSDDRLPMYYALEHEKCPVDIVKHIIAAGSPADGIIELVNGKTTLHVAVSMNHFSIVNFLLNLPVNPNAGDVKGMTPLHYAVQKNYSTVAKLLVRGGANINFECHEHFTPLLYAVGIGNYEMVKSLITLGADIHYVNENKNCAMMPLHFAANLCNLKITQLLLEKGADVNRKVPLTGEIALHTAARADVQNSTQNRVSLNCIVELLLKEGSVIDTTHKFGWTPLQLAIKSKNASVAKILILNGANLNNTVKESDGRRYTTFHLAARTFDKELITQCLDYGADYMAKDCEGMYPCNTSLVTTIIDVVSHTAECVNSIHGRLKFSEHTDLSVFKLFWNYGFPYDLTLDIKWLKPNVLAYPSKVANLVQKQKMLMNGIKHLNIRMVQKAIAQGAEVKCCSLEQRSPLHFIAAHGDELILKELLTRGVPVNTLDVHGETPLHVAATSGHVNCCRLLLEHGAVYNYSTSSLKSPLQLAKQNNHGKVVTLLTTVDKYFKHIKKGKFKKLKPDMKIFGSVMNCCNREGNTLMVTANLLSLKDSEYRLMRMKFQMV